MKRWIVLFDIDGTLIDCGGAGRRAINRAFDRAYGRADACDNIRFGGMTDHAIVREAFSYIGVEYNSKSAAELLALYLEELQQDLAQSESFRVLPGAPEAVHKARAAGHAVGLGTGNVRAGAEAKLARGALWPLFDFGGFGCDAEERPALLAKGRERGLAKLPAGTLERTLVIGDTPKDVRAAKAIGAATLAVASGSFSREQLAAEEPEWLVDSLLDRQVSELFGG